MWYIQIVCQLLHTLSTCIVTLLNVRCIDILHPHSTFNIFLEFENELISEIKCSARTIKTLKNSRFEAVLFG